MLTVDQKIKPDMSSESIDSRRARIPEAFQNYPKHMIGILIWNEQIQFGMLRDITYKLYIVS